ncbi:MAG: class I SAM-dependent methyltransferase [Prevotellaceae bacterium]|jgi:ubiquinone/menaquinone biosynthesis C-methylase UbiE|nr:class I SAM-dependent methyltransferase [Prevotellaceae bacterium]
MNNNMLATLRGKSLVIFGASEAARDVIANIKLTCNNDCLFVVDNDAAKQGTAFCGLNVLSPETLRDGKMLCVVICINRFFNEVKAQCDEYGVLSYHYSEFGTLIRQNWAKYSENLRREAMFLATKNLFLSMDMLPAIIDLSGNKEGAEKDTITDYWSVHTVFHYYCTKTEDIAYQLKLFDNYPLYREYSLHDMDFDGKVILDYGCGPGNDVVWFTGKNNLKKIIGCDVSRKALEISQYRTALHGIDKSKVCLYQISQSGEIPLDDKSIDYINCQGVLMHTANPAKIISEFRRVLKPDGIICIMVYSKDSLWWHYYAGYYLKYLDNSGNFSYDTEQNFNKSTDGLMCPKASCWSRAEFTQILTNAGFAENNIGQGGGYLNVLELKYKRDDIQAALEDDRLDKSHRDFLECVSFDERGYPIYQGKTCGIGGVYVVKG